MTTYRAGEVQRAVIEVINTAIDEASQHSREIYRQGRIDYEARIENGTVTMESEINNIVDEFQEAERMNDQFVLAAARAEMQKYTVSSGQLCPAQLYASEASDEPEADQNANMGNRSTGNSMTKKLSAQTSKLKAPHDQEFRELTRGTDVKIRFISRNMGDYAFPAPPETRFGVLVMNLLKKLQEKQPMLQDHELAISRIMLPDLPNLPWSMSLIELGFKDPEMIFFGMK